MRRLIIFHWVNYIHHLLFTKFGRKLRATYYFKLPKIVNHSSRRWVWRDTIEVQHVSPRQLILTRLAQDSAPLTVTAKQAQDIFNVRFIGKLPATSGKAKAAT